MIVLADLVTAPDTGAGLGVLSTALKTIVDKFDHAPEALQSATNHLTRSLGIIEVALALIAVLLGGGGGFHLLRKALGVATWLWIIGIFHGAAKAFMHLLVDTGATAFGAKSTLLLQPSKILEMSAKATQPLMDKLLGFHGFAHIMSDMGMALLLGLVVLLIWLAYIALALSVALASIEFYLYAALAELLLPFAVLSPTRFIADKAINAVIACAIKLAVITFILTCIEPILADIKIQPGAWDYITWRNIWAMVVIGGLCSAMALWAPRIAAGFLHASPSLSGTALVAEAVGLGAAALALGARVAPDAIQAMSGSFSPRNNGGGGSGGGLAGLLGTGGGSALAFDPTVSAGIAEAAPAPPLYIFFGDQARLEPPDPLAFGTGDEPLLLPAGETRLLPSGGPLALPSGGA